jgi:chromosome segregation ATPase
MKLTLHSVVLIAAAIALALLADAWRSARHDSAQLTATLASQKSAMEQAAEREKQRDAQLSTALEAIAAQKVKIQTPQQAAAAIPSVLPPLPLPISIHLPNLSASSKSKEDLPASISIPQADLKPLYDELQDCRANALESDSTKKDLADQKAQTAALLRERDAALAAAHGGTLWVRLKREAKWFAIGLALGAAATKAAHR